jgi:hypothetical protein
MPPILWTPLKAKDAIYGIALLLVVAHLLIIRGNPLILVLFGLPLALAFAARCDPSSRRSTRIIASIFLALVAAGDLVAPFVHLPGSSFPGLSPAESRMLEWYLIAYLLFIFVVFPPVLFIRPLLDRRRGRPAFFSAFTCYLGLFAWVTTGPMFCLLIFLLPSILRGTTHASP